MPTSGGIGRAPAASIDLAEAANGSAATPDSVTAAGEACAPGDADCIGIERGLGAFVEPNNLMVDDEGVLEFAVATDEQGLVRELGANRPLSPVQQLVISHYMRVTLEDHPDFEILSANGVVKRLSRDLKRTSWQWTVLPKEKGDYVLRARVEVLRPLGNGAYQTLDGYTERVPVNVDVGGWTSFVEGLKKATTAGELLKELFKSWEGTLVALAALIAAIGGVIAAVRALGPKGRQRRARRKTARG